MTRLPLRPQAASRKPLLAFTLIELLVVITIIVILLALLVGGLERALKAAERGKCGTAQRSIAQTCAAYALEFERTFPIATTTAAAIPADSLLVRNNSGPANPTNAQDKLGAFGIGHLMANGRLAVKGEQIHCPSLDTTSGIAVKFGMDEELAPDANFAGASFWTKKASIRSSYNYRGLSYYRTRGNAHIRTNIANSSFVLTTDTISQTAPAGTVGKYGRNFHHLTGWNVSRGDGSVSFVEDPNGPIKINTNGSTNGFVEQKVIGGETTGYKGPNATNLNDVVQAEINGTAKPGADEAVFKYLGSK